jgi:hypothetical protein
MVAAWFDRTQFSCAQCDLEARQGGDLRGELSGAPGQCDGPREYAAFRSHPGGGFTWRGCPRTALDVRTAAHIQVYDRADGKLTATEQRVAPYRLIDGFQVLDYLAALRDWQRAKDLSAQAKGRG